MTRRRSAFSCNTAPPASAASATRITTTTQPPAYVAGRSLVHASIVAVPLAPRAIQHTHTHTHTFNGPLSGTTRVSRYQKGKTNLDFTEARDSGICWAICKSAPRSRQITMPAPNHSGFYRPNAFPATSRSQWAKSVSSKQKCLWLFPTT